MKLIRIDMEKLQVREGPVPEVYERLGGRALIAKLLLEEIPPDCDALGKHNKLIFAPGLLGGAGVATAGRLSVGGKSPLTGGVKEANAGGTAGDALGHLGIKAIVVENIPLQKEFYILHLGDDLAELVLAKELVGLGTYKTSESLQKTYGSSSTVISIGQAGEMKLRGAGVVVTGMGDQRSNVAARGGLGAVMGSKGIKAIVIDKTRRRSIHFANQEQFKAASHEFTQKLVNDPKLGTQGTQHLYGTASIVAAVNELGALPTRNFSDGRFDSSTKLGGECLRETTLARGGMVGTRCMPGCTIACRNVYVDEEGKPIVGTLQYETIALMGSNLGLDNLDDVARLNYTCNDFGLDTIETGAALGVAVEAGLAEFGNYDSIHTLLQEVSVGSPLGKIIGNGAVATGQVLGVRRVPAALGQAMPGYDPRALKGNGVTYATSPQGADHTAGNAFGARKEVNPIGTEGQCALSLKLQIIGAMLDSTGLCLFARPPIIANPQLMVDMINGIFGWNWTVSDYHQFNKEVLRTELEFNHKAGITAKDYRIPEYMREEALPPHQVVFDIPDVELDAVFNTL